MQRNSLNKNRYYVVANQDIETWYDGCLAGWTVPRAGAEDSITNEELLETFPRNSQIYVFNTYQDARKEAHYLYYPERKPYYTWPVFEVTIYPHTILQSDKKGNLFINKTDVQSINNGWVVSSASQYSPETRKYDLTPKQAKSYEDVFKKNIKDPENFNEKKQGLLRMFDKYNFSLWRKHRSMMRDLKNQISQTDNENDIFTWASNAIKMLRYSDRDNACYAVLFVALQHFRKIEKMNDKPLDQPLKIKKLQ